MVILLSLMVAVPSLQELVANVKYWWIGSVSVQATDKAVKCVLSVYTLVQIAVVVDLPSSQILAMVQVLVDALDQEPQRFLLQYSEFLVQMHLPVAMRSI